MTTHTTIDQLEYLFTFPFTDPAWKRKFLIGFLLSFAGFLVPFVPWIFLAGYFSKITKNSIAGEAVLALPEWDDWGELLTLGLRVLAANFLAFLPLFFLFSLGYVAFIAPAFAMEAASAQGDQVEPWLLLSPFVGLLGGMLLFGLSIILGFLVSLFLPPALGHVIAEERFGAAFEIRAWWPIFRANLGGFLLTYVMMMGGLFLMTYVFQILYITVVLCCLLPFISSFSTIYLGAVAGTLFGQAYRVGLARTSLPGPIDDNHGDLEEETSSSDDQAD